MFRRVNTDKKNSAVVKSRMRLMGGLVLGVDNFGINTATSGNDLYDTVKAYANYLKLEVAPLQIIEDTYDFDYDVFDIARASDITFRRITLNQDDVFFIESPLLVFSEDGTKTYILIPYGIGKVRVVDVAASNSHLLTKQDARAFAKEAVSFYRSMPEESLRIKDVLKFGVRSIKTAEIVEISIMMLATTLIGLLMPFFNEQIFDHMIPNSEKSEIIRICIVMLLATISNAIILVIKNRASFRTSSVMSYTISNATTDRLFRLPQSFIERNNATDLVIRASMMGDSMSNLVNGFISVALGLIFSLFYLCRMFSKASKLAWIAILMILITVLLYMLLGWLSMRKEREASLSDMESRNKLFQYLTGIQKIRLTGVEDKALFEYQLANTKAAATRMKSASFVNLKNMIMAVSATLYSTVFYFILMTSDKLDLTMGQISSFMSSFGLFSAAVTSLGSFVVSYATTWPMLKLAEPIYLQKPESSNSFAEIDDFKGQVEVRNVSFSYGDEDAKVLDNVSFKAKSGEYIGIVGKTGSGKSTLLKLLLGFEKPTEGKIFYDGKDSELLNMKNLRKQTGVVLQQRGGLIMGTIYENVAIANSKLSQEDVKALLVEAGMALDLEKMPMGIDTYISEFGGTVSGGQQQRILIARALANNPSLLYFDEATSALDNNAQYAINETLKKRKATRIVIAHRLSTVIDCDRILFLENGRIVESGSYEELMAKKGQFYDMAIRQEA